MQNETTTKEQLRAELKALADTVEQMLKEGASHSKEEIAQLKAKAGYLAKEAKVKLQQSKDDACQHAKELATQADEYVKEKPWQSVGIGAAVGLIVGLLIARR